MAIDLAFRRAALRGLTNKIGCYALCDLDQVPIYVGQSVDGVRARVNRHLTERLQKYHRELLGLAVEIEGDS